LGDFLPNFSPVVFWENFPKNALRCAGLSDDRIRKLSPGYITATPTSNGEQAAIATGGILCRGINEQSTSGAPQDPGTKPTLMQ
jgi:hypothetical protein